MKVLKALTHLEGKTRRRRESQRGDCLHTGCSQTTTGNKPYCLDHLDELPYVRNLIEEIARREARSDNDPDGPDAADVLRQLGVHGAMTLPRLSREIELVPERLLKLIRALQAAGRVRLIELRDERGKRRRIVQPITTDDRPARSPAA
ncbi:MAG: hypothetical protein ACAI25_13195 [Planctomycetota bacterium]